MRTARLLRTALATACVIGVLATPAGSAEFTADIVITGPATHTTYALAVKDPMVRLQKTQGPTHIPPFPFIVNQDTGITWGLNPQMKQVVVMEDMDKTILMNPLVGWAATRKGMTEKPGPVESVNGYECETLLYSEPGKSEVAAKVWVSKKLGHVIREERFGLNENPVLELRNIQEGSLDSALFDIPSGYTRMDTAGGPEPTSPRTPPSAAAASSSPDLDSPTPPSSAAASGNIMFILDASGSMWGQVEGKAKIAIAKEVMTDLIQVLPEDAAVGLVAYGHRRKGDCNDVEELVPLAKIDKSKLIRIIQGLNALGKTPISRSVRLTADRIKHLEDETTIILVSDGMETCDPDPCGLVKELKAAGIQFVMHVIGFDVTDDEKAQLECMAGAGGGRYFTAKTAKDFQMAAREVVRKTREQGFLRLTALRGETPFRAAVDVMAAGENKAVKSGRTGMDPDRRGAPIPPGVYDLRFRDVDLAHQPEVWIRGVEVKAGETVERTAVFAEGGILHVKAVKDNAPAKTFVQVFRQEDGTSMGDNWTREDGSPAEYKLLPGIYKIRLQDPSVKQRPEIWIENVEVKPGETVERIATFGEGGILHVKAIKNNAPAKTFVQVFHQEDGKPMGDNWTREDGAPAEYKLLPGIYKIRLQDPSVKQRPEIWIENVEVKPGETVERVATFGAGGILHVKAIKNNAPAKTFVQVFHQEDGTSMGDNWTREDGAPAEYKLLPGIYKIRLQDPSVKQRPEIWIENVEIKEDQTVERFATFVAGGVLNITATKNGAPHKAYVKVYHQEDNTYMGDGWTREDGGGAEYNLLPGSYTANVEDRGDRTIREIRGIQVQSGKETTVNAVFPVEEMVPEPAPEQPPESAPAPMSRTDTVPSPKTTEGETSSVPSGEQTVSRATVLDGRIPLMEDTTLLKETTVGPNSRIDMEVPASPEEVVNFYKQVMTVKGWQPGMSMVQGPTGVLQLKKDAVQILIKAVGNGQTSTVNMAVMSQ